MQAYRNREIAEEKDLLAATIKGSPSGIAISDARDPEQPLVYVNPAFEAMTGYSQEEVLGQNCRFLSLEPDQSLERQRIRAAVKAKQGGTFVLQNRRKKWGSVLERANPGPYLRCHRPGEEPGCHAKRCDRPPGRRIAGKCDAA